MADVGIRDLRVEDNPRARVADYTAVHVHGSRNEIAAKPIRIGAGAWIGFSATLLKSVTIGENSVVAARSIVTHNVPANAVVAGNPVAAVKSIEP